MGNSDSEEHWRASVRAGMVAEITQRFGKDERPTIAQVVDLTLRIWDLQKELIAEREPFGFNPIGLGLDSILEEREAKRYLKDIRKHYGGPIPDQLRRFLLEDIGKREYMIARLSTRLMAERPCPLTPAESRTIIRGVHRMAGTLSKKGDWRHILSPGVRKAYAEFFPGGDLQRDLAGLLPPYDVPKSALRKTTKRAK